MSAADVHVSIYPDISWGQLPPIWRPGLMVMYADGTCLAELSKLPALGYLRVGCPAFWGSGYYTSTSLETALQGIDRQIPRLQSWIAKGAQLVISLSFTPPWLSRDPSRTNLTPGGVRESDCLMPRSKGEWQELIASVVLAYGDAGIRPRFEFWNEPDNAALFWLDGRENLWQLYEWTREAALDVDPQASLGGCGFVPPSSGLSREFLAHASDFVSLHAFQSQLSDTCADLRSLRARATHKPLLLSEYNLWSTLPTGGPIEPDPARSPDSARYAAYIPAALRAFERCGVAGAMLAALQDFQLDCSGGQGLFTKGPTSPKTAWITMQRLSALHPNRCAAYIAGGQGVGCVVTVLGDSVRALLWRYSDAGPAEVSVSIQDQQNFVLPRYGTRWVEFGW